MAGSTKLFFVLLLGIILLPNMGRAETRYIGDTLIVAIHSGPGQSFPIVSTLRTGNQFTVLDERAGYLQVKTGNDIEGWIQTQYTRTTPPSNVLVPKLRAKLKQIILNNKHFGKEVAALKKQLEQQNAALQNKRQDILAQNATDRIKLENIQQALEQKINEYNELVQQSKQFLRIRSERDRLKKNHPIMQARISLLESENHSMANRRMIYWFLAGGGVLLLGWLIGRTSLKQNKYSLSL